MQVMFFCEFEPKAYQVLVSAIQVVDLWTTWNSKVLCLNKLKYYPPSQVSEISYITNRLTTT